MENALLDGRITHIDQLRGIALLLMILVHAAATWKPSQLHQEHVLAIFVASLGGLAAPLFIFIFGWGIGRSKNTSFEKNIIRGLVLLFAQFLVNLTVPHLFHPFSPGVLTLIALLYIFAPIWLYTINLSFKNIPLWPIICCILLFSPFFFTLSDATWSQRTVPEGVVSWLHLAIFSGTYPILPWLIFAFIGGCVAQEKTPKINRNYVILSGLILSLCFFIYALHLGKTYALPSGEAVLTFFPANVPFLISSLTGIGLLWVLTLKIPEFTGLINLGRFTLTYYIIHFIPFRFWHDIDEKHTWSMSVSFSVIIIYTILFWPLALFHHRVAPNYSLEAWMRRLSSRQ